MSPKLLAAFKAAGYDNITVTETLYGRNLTSTYVRVDMTYPLKGRQGIYHILKRFDIKTGCSDIRPHEGVNECHTPHLFDCGEYRLVRGEWQFKPFTPPPVVIERKAEDDAPKRRKK